MIVTLDQYGAMSKSEILVFTVRFSMVIQVVIVGLQQYLDLVFCLSTKEKALSLFLFGYLSVLLS